MEKFVPYEKLSKKKRKELDARRRVLWNRSPVTRMPDPPKAYNRKKTRKQSFDDSLPCLSFCQKADGQAVTMLSAAPRLSS